MISKMPMMMNHTPSSTARTVSEEVGDAAPMQSHPRGSWLSATMPISPSCRCAGQRLLDAARAALAARDLSSAACLEQFSLDVIKVAQEHGTADRLERCGLGVKDSNVRERPVPAQRTAGPGFDLIASKLRPPPVRSDDDPPPVADRTADARRLPSGRLGGRAAWLREDDLAVAVGRAQQPGLRVGVGRRGRQRPEGPAQLRGPRAGCGAAGWRTGVRGAGLASPVRCPARWCRGWRRRSGR